MFDITMTIAEIEVEFDQELYLPRSINCPYFNCSTQDDIDFDCLCDVARNDSMCGVPSDACGDPTSCDWINWVCDPSELAGWNILQYNKTVTLVSSLKRWRLCVFKTE
jgi:hypothetical protein